MPEKSYQELEPLDIKCTDTDCENGLHCFKQKQARKKKLFGGGEAADTPLAGPCRTCGIDLVDWSRLYRHDLTDVNYTFDALKKELVRHYYWHLVIDQYARNHALRKGSIELRSYVEKRIRTSVGPEQPFLDGRQTPIHQSGNIVHYAQHATASCCRVCIEEWHKIPRGRALTEQEIQYLTELAMRYINERLPELTSEKQRIPPIRHGNRNNRKQV